MAAMVKIMTLILSTLERIPHLLRRSFLKILFCPPSNFTTQPLKPNLGHLLPVPNKTSHHPSKDLAQNITFSYIAKEHLEKFFKQKQEKFVSLLIDLKLPYPIHMATKPYPKKYMSPKFKPFNRKKKNAKEHIIKFIDFGGL